MAHKTLLRGKLIDGFLWAYVVRSYCPQSVPLTPYTMWIIIDGIYYIQPGSEELLMRSGDSPILQHTPFSLFDLGGGLRSKTIELSGVSNDISYPG